METHRYSLFVGVDWASDHHDVTAVDRDGRKILEKIYPHSVDGLDLLVEDLLQLTSAGPENIAIGIEVPHGPVVELLVERCFSVYSLNPKQLDRFRDRYTTIGAKDDRLDAFVLADSLRTNENCFRRVSLSSAEIIGLRSLSRLHDELTRSKVRLVHQLRAQIERFGPHFLKVCSAADKLWFWEFLLLAAHPRDAAKCRKYKIVKLLKEHKIRAHSPDEVWQLIKEQPLYVAPGTIDAAIKVMKVYIAQLMLVDEQLKETDDEIKLKLDYQEHREGKKGEHSDATILRSLPGVGDIVAATILTEATQAVAERNYEALRGQAGVAPVTRRSGKTLVVKMRYACNQRLRTALYHLTRTHVQHDLTSKAKYQKMRSRGLGHARALRGISDRLLKIAVVMLTNRTCYQIERRKSEAA
jgi:transposase